MKIALLCMGLGKGGTERVIKNLSDEFVKTNDVSIISFVEREIGYEYDPRIDIRMLISLDEYSRNRIKSVISMGRKYRHIVEEIKPDVILSFLSVPCLVAGLYRRKLNVPVIGSERSNPYLKYSNPVMRSIANILYSRLDGFVFQSKGAQEFFSKIVQEKSVIIGNPVAIERELVKKAVSIYEDIGFERRKAIVAVGRVRPEKNYSLLIRSFAKISTDYPDYRLEIYGGYDEKYQLKELAASLGVADKVIFMGQTDNVHECIIDAALFVMSSKSEGMPNALMEAMSLGLPVIATDCPSGGAREILEDGVNGRLVANDDVEEMARAISELLDDSEKTEKYARAALSVNETYAIDTIYGKWAEYIERIVQ